MSGVRVIWAYGMPPGYGNLPLKLGCHAYMLCYVIAGSFQKIFKNDVVISVRDFGDGSLATNSQEEIMTYKNWLLQKALSFFGKSIEFEIV